MITKKYPYTLKEYHSIHRKLRYKLSKISFDNYYKCEYCGCHKNLEIHIRNCDPKLINQPGFYIILCEDCHKNVTFL